MKTSAPFPFLLASLAGIACAAADNWPAWRGPTGNGIGPAGDYPTVFSAEENVAWKVGLPGKGSSTPIVWGEQIFVTAPVDGKDALLCIGTDGEEQWRVAFGEERPGKHRNGSGSNPSAVTDGERVFAYFKSGALVALDLEGEVQWKVNLQEEFGADTLWWDLGTSPVLAAGNVVVAVMQEGESYVAAFDCRSGKLAWKADRTYKVKKETGQSYTTPLVVGQGRDQQLIIFGADRLTSHRAKDGKLLWECGGYNPQDKAMWRVIASPSISDGIVVVPYGRTDYFAAVKVGGQGDVTETNRLWEVQVGADVPSPIAVDGKAYLVRDRGHIYCFDLKSGDERWNQKLPRESASYYASPLLAGDLMVLPREDGVVMTMRVGEDGFKLLGQNDMGERIVASPVPLGGKLLIRGEKHLFCVGG